MLGGRRYNSSSLSWGLDRADGNFRLQLLDEVRLIAGDAEVGSNFYQNGGMDQLAQLT